MLLEHETHSFYQVPVKPKQPWGQIFISIAAIVVTLIGAKVEGFNWILYFAVPILVITFLLMILDTPLVVKVKTWYRKIHEKRVISKCSDQYIEYLDKFKIAEEIIDKIRDMEWGSIKERQYYFSENKLEDLKQNLSDDRHSRFSKVIFLNRALNVYLGAVDKYIKECDWLVVQREITYKYEHDKSKMLKLIHKYDSIKEEHNLCCSKVNKFCSGETYLRQIYEHTFSFMPKDIR